MKLNIGLKLWSTNENYIDEAVRLYENKTYDYIELFTIPGTLKNITMWKSLNIPYIIHAPHFANGLNFADKIAKEKSMILAREAIEFADLLNAKYIIFHPGIGGDIIETVKCFNELDDKRIVVENKPYFIERDESICNGATFEEIKYVLNNTSVGFCFDFGHATCSANAQKIDFFKYIMKFLSLNPCMYHLTDNDVKSVYDKHFHFGDGNLPLKRILSLLQEGDFITIETYKNSKENLDDFVKDVDYLKALL